MAIMIVLVIERETGDREQLSINTFEINDLFDCGINIFNPIPSESPSGTHLPNRYQRMKLYSDPKSHILPRGEEKRCLKFEANQIHQLTHARS